MIIQFHLMQCLLFEHADLIANKSVGYLQNTVQKSYINVN